MSQMHFFLPLIKADAEKRLIFARAVHEVPDRSGEIFDYASSKPNIQAWSDSVARDSNGLSKGNVRVMHTKNAVGKVTDLNFNDEEKAVDVVIKVVDDQEWRKVEEGIYTGVSIGGSYGNKWQDNGMTRYTAKPTEISLVDRPCIPTAVFFDLQKADGAVQQVRFKATIQPTFADAWASRPLSFAERWATRPAPVVPPMTFGEMVKFDESKHPRNHGEFASKGGQKKDEEPKKTFGQRAVNWGARYIGGAVGLKAGSYAERKTGFGARLGAAAQPVAAHMMVQAAHSRGAKALWLGAASTALAVGSRLALPLLGAYAGDRVAGAAVNRLQSNRIGGAVGELHGFNVVGRSQQRGAARALKASPHVKMPTLAAAARRKGAD